MLKSTVLFSKMKLLMLERNPSGSAEETTSTKNISIGKILDFVDRFSDGLLVVPEWKEVY